MLVRIVVGALVKRAIVSRRLVRRGRPLARLPRRCRAVRLQVDAHEVRPLPEALREWTHVCGCARTSPVADSSTGQAMVCLDSSVR